VTARITVRNGSVYLDRQTVDRYFPGIDAVVILIRDGDLQILPVHRMAAGGCLLKIRNAAGDRVASAADVFLEHGLQEWTAVDLEAAWSRDLGALTVNLSVN